MENYHTLKELLEYDGEIGALRWKVSRGGKHPGDIAGHRHHSGYYDVRVNDKLYQLHRIIWILVTGENIPEGMEVDHEDGDLSNNFFHNLRLSTVNQNAHNKSNYCSNTTGVKGVGWHKGKLRGRIQINGKQIHVGYFDSLEEAEIEMKRIRNKLHKDFARHE